MTAPAATTDIESLIDDTVFGPRQKTILLLCCALAMIEGFDVQVMGLVAPDIAAEWGIRSALFGPVFSVSLFGGMIGGFLISFLGGRAGPKASLLTSVTAFALCTLLTIFATDVIHLIVLRAIAGIGLGAAVPGLVAIVSSYTPKRLRSLAVTTTTASQMLGAVIGGAIAAPMVPAFGWQSAFLFGGTIPLLLVALAMKTLPESMSWLILRRGDHARVAAILASLGKPASAITTYHVPTDGGRISIGGLLTPRFRVGTLAFWATCMIAAVFFFMLVNWLPTVLRDAGAGPAEAIMGSVVLNAGGFSGAVLLSRAMDRFNPYTVVALGYVTAALFIVLMILMQGQSGPIVLAATFAAGFFSLGTYFSLTSLQAHFYPAYLLNIAVGCAMGFARIGAVIGPLAGSLVLTSGGHAREMFALAAGISVLAAATTAIMRRAAARQKTADATGAVLSATVTA